MQTEALLRIPFTIITGKQIVEGTIKGGYLQPYEVYEVHLSSGDILNMEAIPCEGGIKWFSFQQHEMLPLFGQEVEHYFSSLCVAV